MGFGKQHELLTKAYFFVQGGYILLQKEEKTVAKPKHLI